MNIERSTYSLVIHDGHLLDATKSTELVIEVALARPDAKAKDTKDLGGVGGLEKLN